MQDAFDITWKLAAVLNGWGGQDLLTSYDKERRAVALLTAKAAEKATNEVVLPWLTSAREIGYEKLIESSTEGQAARDSIKEIITLGRWIHEQDGTVMGYRYNKSPIIIADISAVEPPSSITEYFPNTWPGARAPHVFLRRQDKHL